MGDFLQQIGYKSPAEKGGWRIKDQLHFVGFPGVRFDIYEHPASETLDHAIYSVLKAEYAVKHNPADNTYRNYFEPFEGRLENGHQFHSVQELRDFLGGITPNQRFQDFLRTHRDPFSSAVLLASRNCHIALAWSLNMEDEFWPLATILASRDHTPYAYYKFDQELKTMKTDFLFKAGKKVYTLSAIEAGI